MGDQEEEMVLAARDAVLLPVPNITGEALSQLLLSEFVERCGPDKLAAAGVRTIRVGVSSGPGQTVTSSRSLRAHTNHHRLRRSGGGGGGGGSFHTRLFSSSAAACDHASSSSSSSSSFSSFSSSSSWIRGTCRQVQGDPPCAGSWLDGSRAEFEVGLRVPSQGEKLGLCSVGERVTASCAVGVCGLGGWLMVDRAAVECSVVVVVSRAVLQQLTRTNAVSLTRSLTHSLTGWADRTAPSYVVVSKVCTPRRVDLRCVLQGDASCGESRSVHEAAQV